MDKEESSKCPFVAESIIQKCPFLRNINKPTTFSLSSLSFSTSCKLFSYPLNLKVLYNLFFYLNVNVKFFYLDLILIQVVQGGSTGPIFEDGPGFDSAFKLFHGKDGIVPLSGHSSFIEEEKPPQFNPLAGKVATISLSAFGSGGPFSFGPFSDKHKKQRKKPNKQQVRRLCKKTCYGDQ